MKRVLLFLLLCVMLSLGASWAGTLIGTTQPAVFSDTVAWCQFGCAGASVASDTAWTSVGGATGTMGLVSGQNFLNRQQGHAWSGNFVPDMGLVWNAVPLGNTPTNIFVKFDRATYGAGAYIQSDLYGSFSATAYLYDVHGNLLDSYSANGVSNPTTGTALFLGMTDSVPEVYAIRFAAVGSGGDSFEPDFSIGSLSFTSGPEVTISPEPASLLLAGPALLALAAIRRRRMFNPGPVT